MTRVSDIYTWIKSIAPEEMKEDFDNVGLLCGRSGNPVTDVLIALDITPTVCEEAKSLGAQLIVSHHPAIFYGKNVSDTSAEGSRLLYMIENGIAAISAHTNLDKAPGGVNDCLARALGLENVCVLDPEGTDAQGRPYGLLRAGTIAPRTAGSFAAFVRDSLHCAHLRYVEGEGLITRVAVGGGACADRLPLVFESGCDAFVTADVKYHTFLEAKELGITLLDAGHFQTENVVCAELAREMRGRFPELTVSVSKTHTDCIKFA
ncbi:MAG: Nif3-like dinuclear metal center hexameric protein [Oscillospiraceae bacterium]|jgi:dinuclear metal center YbgI/SA1388 family protein|nr:Nif3-like dinuclear metal center hexameric protein [Oscillospiraceae bacterium]